MNGRRVLELARGLLALVGLVILVLGVPAALAVGVGWPLSHSVPSAADLHRLFSGGYHPTGSFYLRVVAVVAWIAWFEVAVCAVSEVRAALNGRRAWRVRLAGPVQPLIASLVAAVVLALPMRGAGAPAHAPSLAVALSTAPSSRPALLVDDEFDGATREPPVGHRAGPHRHDEALEPVTVTVRPRDTLWGLAERYLGNPLDWKEIFDLNAGKPQLGGGALTDPSLIRVGWVLELPRWAADRVPVERSREHRHSGATERAGQTPHPGVPARQAVPPRSTGEGKRPVPKAPAGHPHDFRRQHVQPSPATPTAPGALVELPTGALVSTSFLAGVAAAVALGRLRRRRRYRPRQPAAGWSGRGWAPSPSLAMLLRAGQPADDDELSSQEDSGAPTAAPREVDVPLGHVLVGQRGDDPVIIEIAAGGLGLDGPGAEDTARALIADIAARHEPGHLDCVVDSGVWRDLLGDIEPFPGLRKVTAVDDFLREAEVELIRRVRLLEEDDLDNLDTYWKAHPEDPMPILLLVCREPPSTFEGRIAGIVHLGRRVGITALILGDGSITEARATVAADGLVNASTPLLEGAQLITLGRAEAQAALEAVSAVRRVEDAPDREQTLVMTESSSGALPMPASTPAAPIKVQLLGSFRILVDGEEVRTGMRMKARELLAWFCCHPEGGTPEAVVEALWPEVDPSKVSQRFWNALTSLRGCLREVTGLPELRILDRYGTRYRLVDHDLAVDLWDLDQALASGSNDSGEASAPAIERAAGLYSGDLLEDCDWLWVEALRGALRSRVLDELVRLSECAERVGQTDRAIGLLDRSIAIEPFAEELYQRKLRLLAAAGRPEAVQRTFRELTARLDEIGVDPADASCHLARVDS